MLLLIMCRDLEVADRRMTTAIKLVLAHAFVSGATSLVHQLVRKRVLHRRPFPERGPSTPRLQRGAQFLLARLILAEAHASAVSVGGCGALGSHGTRVTRRRWKLGRRAGDPRDSLATRTGPLHSRKVQAAILRREQWTDLRPGASDTVHPRLRPWGNPWAGHVPQVDIALQQARGFLPLLGPQLHPLMLRRIRRADHHLPGEAVEGFRAAFAAVAQVLLRDGETPVRRDGLLETSPARSTPRVWRGVVRENLRDGRQDLLQRRVRGRQGLLLLQPALPPGHLLQDQAQRAGAHTGLPPLQVQCRCATALAPQRQPSVLHARLRGRAQFLGRKAHRLAQRLAEPVPRVLAPAGTAQGGESKTARSCLAPKPPVCSAQATVRSSSVLSRLCAMRRRRKLSSVPWLQGGCSAPRPSSTLCQRWSSTVRSTASGSLTWPEACNRVASTKTPAATGA
jgi:hypothetical protein